MAYIQPPPLPANCLTSKAIVIECDPESVSSELSIIKSPTGSAATIAEPTATTTSFTPDVPGLYTVQLCCFFNLNPDAAPPVEPGSVVPFVGCPKGIAAGETADIALLGCEDGQSSWTATGPIVGIAENSNGAIITTQAGMTGTVNVTMTCEITDADNNVTTIVKTCSFEVYDETLELTPETSELLCVETVPCGTYCEKTTQDYIVTDCGTDDCVSARICIVVKDCTPCPEEPEC